jgi:AmiR/NasT family two-component response regulator
VREAREAGALGYLVKPLDVPRIIPSLETALARARDLAGLRESEEKLVAALQNSREISTAIGLLMERHGKSAEQAFEMLREQARGPAQEGSRCRAGHARRRGLTPLIPCASSS